MNYSRGFGFRIAGLVLAIISLVISVLGIVFASIGLHRAQQCKHCKMEGMYK